MSDARSPAGREQGAREQRLGWGPLLSQMVRYGIFGGTGALADFLTFTALHTWFNTPVVATNVVSILVGISVSFLLNSRLTFATTDHPRRRAVRFLSVGLAGMAVSSALIELMVGPLGLDAVLAKLITVPVIALLQFAANRWWTFGPIRES
ncbi:MAG: GtrA family protein [Propionibacteriaceae bacterium]|nr:GtrA family protein [Propionibacteriaceae bacterium]